MPAEPARPLAPATDTESLVPPPVELPSPILGPAEPDAEPSTNDIERLFQEESTETPPPTAEPPAGDVDIEDLFRDTLEQPESPPVTQPVPPAVQPATDDLDDLFGQPPAGQTEGPAADGQPPSETPPAADENLNDLFGDAPREPAAASSEESMADPSTSELDDLFGPSAVEDSQVQPAAAQEEASSDLDDLFADPGLEDSNPAGSPPADPAAPQMDAEDLFNSSPPADVAPPELDTDDLFNDSSSQSVPPVPKADDPASLARQDVSPPVRAIARPVAHVEGATNGQVGMRPVGGGPLPMRRWTDNTGIYHTTAQLAEVGEGFVRLLKDTGRYTTVPLRRLSKTDLRYVSQHSATSLDEADHVAQR